jgi:hypothetical protein
MLVPALGFMLGEKMWWPAHFHPEDAVSTNRQPPQLVVPDAQLPPMLAQADDPPLWAPEENPLPDWTRVGGSSRYR